MKKIINFLGIALPVAAIVFGFAACPDGNKGGGNGNTNPTPVAADFDIGNMIQTAGGVTAVTVMPKEGKSNGAITVWYVGSGTTTYKKSKTPPQDVGTYAVTFDVAAVTGWKAATGLSAGNLTVNTLETPVATDYNISNLAQSAGGVTAVTVTPINGKSPGGITIWYAGTNGTAYAKSTSIPQAVGTYAVTFDVAAVTGWNPATGLSAGTLVVRYWTAISSAESIFGDSAINGVAYGGAAGSGKWVVVGDEGKMAYSTDGVAWTPVTDSTFDTSAIWGVAYGVAAGSGKWVAVGAEGKMAYSADGETWTEISATDSTFGDSVIRSIAYGDGKWVAGGDGGMAYSANGETWTTVTDSITIQSVAYGGAAGSGKWVAVGNGGRMAYSANGETWTTVTDSIFSLSAIWGVAYGGAAGSGKWVAGGSGGRMGYSADGVAWTAVTDSKFGTSSILGVAYGGAAGSGKWVAGGNGGKMAYSANGETWTAISATDNTFDPSAGITGVAYGNGKWVAVGFDDPEYDYIYTGKMAYSYLVGE